jgi:bifunctional NMN adenylyltransferase/nudix hydrolase
MTKTDYQFDYLVFIGRFQPFHPGHCHVAQEALKLSKHLIFVIGSHDKPRSIRNPFTTAERIEIIRRGLEDYAADDLSAIKERSRIHFCPQVDRTYNDIRWLGEVQASVNTVISNSYEGAWQTGHVPRIGIVGYEKDHTSFYLKKFPQWKLVPIEPKYLFSATEMRHILFGDQSIKSADDFYINPGHLEAIVRFAELPEVITDYAACLQYQAEWGPGPHMTADALVTQAGHILLVTRKEAPGAGQWALPGGFLGANETLFDCSLRELREETRLAVPNSVMVGSVNKMHLYDDPHRSDRARIITQAYHYKLSDMDTGLPRVKGSDDAKKAEWVPISQVMQSRSKMFEDHYSIIEHMLGL